MQVHADVGKHRDAGTKTGYTPETLVHSDGAGAYSTGICGSFHTVGVSIRLWVLAGPGTQERLVVNVITRC